MYIHVCVLFVSCMWGLQQTLGELDSHFPKLELQAVASYLDPRVNSGPSEDSVVLGNL